MQTKATRYFLIAILILSATFAPRSIGQSSAPQNVVWSNVINCTVTGNSLQKTGGRSDSSDAGARSQQTVSAGDVYFEFTAGDVNKILFCGLTHAASGTAFSEIDFAVKLTDSGVAEVRENNAYGGETSCRTGDVFRIAVQGNVVKYYKNGGLYYTSSKAPVYPLFAQADFLTIGGRVDNAVIGALAVTSSASWTTYQHDSTHSGNSSESQIGASNVASLTQAWNFTTGDMVTGTPLISDGVVYIGSWDGKMYALRERDGSLLWNFNAGTLRVDACDTTYGIDSTAALSNGKLYFGTGLAQLISLNAANGQLNWRTQLADPNLAFHIWGSPLVFDGKIYIGLASHCVNPCIVGRLVCVDANDGRVLWSFATASEGSTGGAVWSSPAVDASRRMIYVGTGNFCTGADLHSSAIIALNADTGALIWRFKRLPQADTNNLDFGSSPVLYDVDGTPMLALPSKDGHCYGLNRATGSLVWDTVVTDGNSRGGSIASPAAAYGKVFFGGTVNVATGMFVALDQRDGRIVWRASQSLPILGATAAAGGVVFVGCDDGALHAYDASTGTELWNAQRSPMLGGVSISTTSVIVGSLDRNVYAFALPSAPPPPPPPAAAAVSVNLPTAGDQWTKGEKYDVSWSVSGPVSRVDVSISRDGGGSWEVLATGVDSSAGRLEVKAKKPKSSATIVRVTDTADTSIFGQSGMFSIK
jgi:outer membrane protein assembly factor BamB